MRLPGAVVGGFLLALIDTTLNYTLSQDLLKFRDAFTFSLVILILLWRPDGPSSRPGQRSTDLRRATMKHLYLTALILIGVILVIGVGSQMLGIRLYDRIATNLLISLVLVVGLQRCCR